MESLRVLVHRELIAAWRYRWAAVAFAWVVSVGGWFVVFMIPNQFEASARIFVDVDAVLTPLLRGLALDSGLASQLDMLQRTLLSRPNLEKLISKTDLDLNISGPADLESMVAGLAQRDPDRSTDAQSVHDHLPQPEPQARLRRGADDPRPVR